jgi:hypothetical protein
MEMDTTNLMFSLLFGSIGLGMFLYGKKAGRVVPLGAGLALMVLPYCIPNVIALLIVSCLLTASPWLVRDSA